MGKKPYNFSEDQLSRARDLRASGMSWFNIGARLNFHTDTIRRRLDPEYAEHIRFKYTGPKAALTPGESRISSAETKRLIAGVPPDTRSPYARLMGDPMPGRSALDKRLGAQ